MDPHKLRQVLEPNREELFRPRMLRENCEGETGVVEDARDDEFEGVEVERGSDYEVFVFRVVRGGENAYHAALNDDGQSLKEGLVSNDRVFREMGKKRRKTHLVNVASKIEKQRFPQFASGASIFRAHLSTRHDRVKHVDQHLAVLDIGRDDFGTE